MDEQGVDVISAVYKKLARIEHRLIIEIHFLDPEQFMKFIVSSTIKI
jgi:hypothetical protein